MVAARGGPSPDSPQRVIPAQAGTQVIVERLRLADRTCRSNVEDRVLSAPGFPLLAGMTRLKGGDVNQEMRAVG